MSVHHINNSTGIKKDPSKEFLESSAVVKNHVSVYRGLCSTRFSLYLLYRAQYVPGQGYLSRPFPCPQSCIHSTDVKNPLTCRRSVLANTWKMILK
jgi:hypothetical protein